MYMKAFLLRLIKAWERTSNKREEGKGAIIGKRKEQMSSEIEATKDKGRPLLSPGFSCLGSAPLGKEPSCGWHGLFPALLAGEREPCFRFGRLRAVGGKRGSLPSLMRPKLQADALWGPWLVPRLRLGSAKAGCPSCTHLCASLCSLATPRTVARQAPLSVGFLWQEDWRGFPFPPPGDLAHPGIKSWVLYPWPIWQIYGPLQIRLNGLRDNRAFENSDG